MLQTLLNNSVILIVSLLIFEYFIRVYRKYFKTNRNTISGHQLVRRYIKYVGKKQ
jgi:hypothetical protein